jgi:plasmid stabilization system protein ParE
MMGHPSEISEAAEKDWQRIVAYTLYNFGRRQVYRDTEDLLNCLYDLVHKVDQHKIIAVSDYKVVLKRCQKHYIFRQIKEGEPLLIIATYHEQMDLMQGLKNRLS